MSTPRADVDEGILRLAEETSWHAALASSMPDDADLWRRYAEEQTGDWMLFLPPSTRGRMLLMGASNAQVCAVARLASKVVVPCRRSIDAAFLAVQARQSGLHNVQPVVTDGLPFAADSFDAIAALEPHVNLDAIRLLLRESGHFHLTASNRHIGGESDSGTYAGLRRRIREAGLDSLRAYGVPDEKFVSLTGATHTHGPLGWRDRLKRTRLLSPRFHFVAHAHASEPSWLEGLFAHVSETLGLGKPKGFPAAQRSGAWSSGALMFIGDAAIVRIALDPRSEARVRRNFEALERCRDGVAATLGVTAPAPLILDRFGGILFSAESRLEGTPLPSLAPSRWQDVGDRISAFLRRRQEVTPDTTDPATQWRQHAVETLVRARAWAGGENETRMLARLEDWARAFDPSRMPLTFTHGDFHPGNLLLDADGELALVDWDRWHPAAPATIDYYEVVCRRRAATGGEPAERIFADWWTHGPRDAVERTWAANFERDFDLPTDWQRAAALCYWTREIAPRVGTPFDLKRRWIRGTFGTLLPVLHRVVLGQS